MRHLDDETLFDLAKVRAARIDRGASERMSGHFAQCRHCREALRTLADELDDLEDSIRSDTVLA